MRQSSRNPVPNQTSDQAVRAIEHALRRDGGVRADAIELSARVASAAAVTIGRLPAAARQAIEGRQTEFIARLVEVVRDFSEAERSQVLEGEGVGHPLSEEEGGRALDQITIRTRIEDWAGPVAGASELMRAAGIARSTLHLWHKNKEVVGLLKGAKKHVFPLEQFVDGRPLRGLSDILGLVGDARVAWHWLITPSPLLDGERPIDLLKRNRVADVLEAAEIAFASLAPLAK